MAEKRTVGERSVSGDHEGELTLRGRRLKGDIGDPNSTPRISMVNLVGDAPSPELIGRRLGDFTIKSRLGQGGFGTVYLAEQILLERMAVVKVLHVVPLEHSAMRQRFLREARLASKLDHPFAAHVYAFGAETDGLLWMAMELVRGTPLNQWIRTRGKVPLSSFVPFFDRLCEVVDTLHQQGIIHRDLKPANVMVLSRAGRLLPKLLDLGVAKIRDESPGSDENPHSAAARLREILAGPDPTSPFQTSDTASLPRGSDEGPASQSEDERAADFTGRLTDALGQGGRRVNTSAPTDLTSADELIGSPSYMAPEQWLSPAAVDFRTDVYALGILAYEALVGRLPFQHKNRLQLAAAHVRDPPPSMGTEISQAVQEIIQRSLAKKKEDRFPNALSFAAALHCAADLPRGVDTLPELNQELRQVYLNEAPQPLAEAMAMLEAAPNAGRGLGALRDLIRVALRYLGVLALAAHARTGSGERSSAVLAAFERLRKTGLNEREWWRLVRELCRPFQSCPDAHPLPELVLFCAHEESNVEADLLGLLEGDQGEPEESAQADYAEALKISEPWLQRLLFLREFPLVFCRDGVLEKWTGLRRPKRPILTAQGDPQAPNHLALANGRGELLVSLHPLLQAISPTPGAAEEIFFLEGPGRYGARLVAFPLGFERHDEETWNWYRVNLADVEDRTSGVDQEEQAPYMGLASFTASQAKNFFGREREAEAVANRLRAQPLLAIVGPSGAGKSSFVQAGVIPLLPESWKPFIVRPGPSPISTLSALLSTLGLEALKRRGPGTKNDGLRVQLQSLAAREKRTVLLIIDQFEELVTLCADSAEQEEYAELVAQAAKAADSTVRVVLTLRDDFLIRIQSLAAFRDRLPQGLQLLSTPGPDDLLRIVTEPARRAGYHFDSPELPAEMVREVEKQPSALALLSFTASRLWELRDRDAKSLTRKAYQALGGVGGALAHHAEQLLAGLAEPAQKLVREAFRHLVTAEGTRAILSRQQMVEVLGNSELVEPTLEKLIAARLLVASEGTGGEDRIEVVHEALLSSWPRLVKWQKDDAENVRMRDQLRAAARQWEERRRDKGLLWRGDLLLEYRLWRKRFPGSLTRSEEAFAAAALRDDARARQLKRVLLATALTILSLGVIVLQRAYRRADAASHEAAHRLAENHFEQGRVAMLAGNIPRALVYLDTAFSEGIEGPGIRYMLGEAIRDTQASVAIFEAHHAAIMGVAISPGGAVALTGGLDRVVRGWRLQTGEQVRKLTMKGDVLSVSLSPDGSRIAAGGTGALQLWDLATGRKVGQVDPPSPDAVIGAVGFSPQGGWLATLGYGAPLQIWDARTGKQVSSVPSPGLHSTMAFSADGSSLVTCPGWNADEPVLDHTAVVWDVPSLRRRLALAGHSDYVRSVAFSPDGRRIATGSKDTTVRLWDAATGKSLLVLEGHRAIIRDLRFSPDGKLLATASDDHSVRLWDTRSGATVQELEAGQAPVGVVRFSPDGRRLMAGSDDGTVRLWDVQTGELLGTFIGHTERVMSAEFSQDGKDLVTTSTDGTARVWNASFSYQLLRLPRRGLDTAFQLDSQRGQVLTLSGRTVALADLGSPSPVFSGVLPAGEPKFLAWSPGQHVAATEDGAAIHLWQLPGLQPVAKPITMPALVTALDVARQQTLLVGAAYDGTIRVWDWEAGTPPRELGTAGAPSYAVKLSPDDRRLAVGTAAGDLVLWDVTQRRKLWERHAHSYPISRLAFSADGSELAAGSLDQKVSVWDTRSSEQLAILRGHSAPIDAVDFSPDGQLLLTSGADGDILLWETASWTNVGRIAAGVGVQKAAFTPDGNEIITGASQVAGMALWPAQRTSWTPPQVDTFVRCYVPLELKGRQIVSRARDCSARGLGGQAPPAQVR